MDRCASWQIRVVGGPPPRRPWFAAIKSLSPTMIWKSQIMVAFGRCARCKIIVRGDWPPPTVHFSCKSIIVDHDYAVKIMVGYHCYTSKTLRLWTIFVSDICLLRWEMGVKTSIWLFGYLTKWLHVGRKNVLFLDQFFWPPVRASEDWTICLLL